MGGLAKEFPGLKMPEHQPATAASDAAMSKQERMAREYLAQGKFRKARDEFKVLVKLDRPKFLPLLVEANFALAREMLGKGMVSEARQLIEYLKTIAPPSTVLALELEAGATPKQPPPNWPASPP